MVDKIKLHASGGLPSEYHGHLGEGFDGKTLRFLGLDYGKVKEEVLSGKDAEELTRAALDRRQPTAEEIEIFNGAMAKRGWRDSGTPMLRERHIKWGLPEGKALTFFDLNDLDEEKPARFGPNPPLDPAPPRPLLEGVRSPYETVGGLVHFGRMIDKIKLHARGKLPESHVAALGGAADSGHYDARVCRFLGIPYERIADEAKRGGSDGELFALACREGRTPTEEEIEMFNGFLSKLCWRDAKADRLAFRLNESGLPPRAALTMFDYIDIDEGRPHRIFS
jgi:gluconokinase